MCSVSPRSVLITGANRGIGFEMVKQLTQCNEPPKFVIATYRNLDGAKELLKLAEKHKCVRPIKLDVRDVDSYEKIVAEVSLILGNDGLNCLINNAGIFRSTPFGSITKNEMVAIFEVNAIPHLLLTRAFIPLLRKGFERTKGIPFTWYRAAVINISSIAGSLSATTEEFITGFTETVRNMNSSRIVSAALNMTTRLLSIELKGDNVLVTGVDPGWVQTDMGGKDAPVTPAESASNILSTLEKLTKSETGLLVDFHGLTINF